MPKVRSKERVGGIRRNVTGKFRIGTRSAGKSAHLMTTDELLKVIEDPNKKRYTEKARTVLSLRGVTV